MSITQIKRMQYALAQPANVDKDIEILNKLVAKLEQSPNAEDWFKLKMEIDKIKARQIWDNSDNEMGPVFTRNNFGDRP